MSGAALGSRAFARIWERPYLVDQLLQIWEQRQKDQRQRDEWQYRALVMADDAATTAYNVAVDKDDRVRSRMALIFPENASSTPEIDALEEFKSQGAMIASAERERREARKK